MTEDPPDRQRGMNDLRQRAERRVLRPRADMGSMSSDQVSRLVYDLEIHEEELEIQNEELRHTQCELRDSRDRFVDLYDFAPVGYLTLNTNGEIVQANLTTCKMLGTERSKLFDIPLALFCELDCRADLRAHLDDVFSSGQQRSIELKIDANGKFDAHLESCRSTRPNDDQHHCRTVITDISARKQAERTAQEKDRQLRAEMKNRQRAEDRLREYEKQLAHLARVNTLGEMVAGIAHEINQPLAAISNFATACEIGLQQRSAGQDEDLLKMTREISKQAIRAGEIIRRLRRFVVRAETTRTRLQINAIIDESIQLTASEARRHGVLVRLAVQDDLQDVVADRVQIQQVLVNLFNNAYHALASVAGDRIVTIRASTIDGNVDVAVEDSGDGLAPEIRDHVFDAFVSTKADGMGLGLAISRSIIEAHGGRIWVTSHSTRGTVFRFTLPAKMN